MSKVTQAKEALITGGRFFSEKAGSGLSKAHQGI